MQARSEAPANDGWGNKSQQIVRSTDDGIPAAPTVLQVTTKNMTCFRITWASPTITNGQITLYKVSIAYSNRKYETVNKESVSCSTASLTRRLFTLLPL